LIISHSKEFVFIHIYKVAGTSVRSALRPYADVTFRRITPRRILYVMGLASAPADHATARDVRAYWLNDDRFVRYFKFAFVRNPWDWQVSLYHYITSHKLHPQHRRLCALGSFEKYIMSLNEESVQTQRSFLVDESGELLVDYIGKFETIEADFNLVCEKLGVDTVLPQKNVTRRGDFVDYYCDRTSSKIEHLFRDDIKMFDYQSPTIRLG
jgi:hypothetical protein